MANTTLTSSIINKQAQMVLQNELTLAKAVNTEYADKFGQSGAKIGATYNLRKPPRYLGREGEALQVEASTENYVPIVINRLTGTDITFSTTDLKLNVEDFTERFISPAITSVANKIDVAIANLFSDVNRLVNHGATAASYGTSGALNGGSQTLAGVQGQILTAGAILTENGVPPSAGKRALTVDAISQVSFITPMTGLFNPSSKISSIFEDAAFATNTLGFDWAVDANIAQFTPQAAGSLTAISAVPASGATTLAVTTTAGTVPKGTVFSIAGVYAINPQSRASTGRLMQFVVTADTVVTTTGTLPIYPAYIPSGQFATCTGTPTSTAAITIWSGAVGAASTSQNLAFHKNAFALVTVDQELPEGVHFASRNNYKGISLRIVRQYDINSNQIPARIEVLYGVKTIYPELAVRLGG
ncbi:MAG: P22 phage major capsid protein family protein [Candidatus Paceibacterota bacterium]